MKNYIFLILLFLAFLFISCDENNTEAPLKAIYQYTSYDTTKTPMVEGFFTLDIDNSNNISGEWSFNAIGNSENTGPQVGNGELKGKLELNEISIELNPQAVDNNLHLTGTMANNRISGTWQWINYFGISNYGTFEAIKR